MARGRPLNLAAELIEEFEHCASVTTYVVGTIPKELWRSSPPSERGRTIAGIVAHIQSVRRMLAKMGGARPTPLRLDRLTVTPEQAARALQQSHDALAALFRRSLEAGETRVKGMPRRTVNMIAYLIQHDAHHRGQIFTLARDLDHEFTSDEIMRAWGWKKLP